MPHILSSQIRRFTETLFSPEMKKFLEGATIYTFYAIAAIGLSHQLPDHLPGYLQTLLSANLPVLGILAISLVRETLENRRWHQWLT